MAFSSVIFFASFLPSCKSRDNNSEAGLEAKKIRATQYEFSCTGISGQYKGQEITFLISKTAIRTEKSQIFNGVLDRIDPTDNEDVETLPQGKIAYYGFNGIESSTAFTAIVDEGMLNGKPSKMTIKRLFNSGYISRIGSTPAQPASTSKDTLEFDCK